MGPRSPATRDNNPSAPTPPSPETTSVYRAPKGPYLYRRPRPGNFDEFPALRLPSQARVGCAGAGSGVGGATRGWALCGRRRVRRPTNTLCWVRGLGRRPPAGERAGEGVGFPPDLGTLPGCRGGQARSARRGPGPRPRGVSGPVSSARRERRGTQGSSSTSTRPDPGLRQQFG